MDLSEVRAELGRLAWPAGWSLCSSAEERALAMQLEKELRPGHALHGRGCVAVAKGPGTREVLYYVPAEASPLAVVALTWQVPREEGSFPWLEAYESVEAWARATRLRE